MSLRVVASGSRNPVLFLLFLDWVLPRCIIIITALNPKHYKLFLQYKYEQISTIQRTTESQISITQSLQFRERQSSTTGSSRKYGGHSTKIEGGFEAGSAVSQAQTRRSLAIVGSGIIEVRKCIFEEQSPKFEEKICASLKQAQIP